MLSRLIPKPSHLRHFFSLPSKSYPLPLQTKIPNLPLNPFFAASPKHFSTNSNNNNNNGNGKDPFSPVKWRGFGETEEKLDSFFDDDAGSLAGMKDDEEQGGGAGAPAGKKEEEEWWLQEKGLDDEDEDAIFKGIDKEGDEGKGGVGDFGSHLGMGAMDFKPWSLKEEKEEEVKDDVFGFQEEEGDAVGMKGEFDAVEGERSQEDVEKLEKEEKELNAILKG